MKKKRIPKGYAVFIKRDAPEHPRNEVCVVDHKRSIDITLPLSLEDLV